MKTITLSCLLLLFGAAHAETATPPGTSGAAAFEAAKKAAGDGNHDTAFDQFEAALTVEPNNLRFGATYRQLAIEAGAYDRCLAFLEALVTANPEAPNAYLNYAFAHVDKIPVEGSITGVILADRALGYFTTSLELEESWLGRYSRGNSYLYWPTIFGRAPKAIADLERAVEMSKQDERQKSYYARAYVALGDGYWRVDEREKMREIWREGLALFAAEANLTARLSREDEALDAFLEEHFDPTKRVETHLNEIWAEVDK